MKKLLTRVLICSVILVYAGFSLQMFDFTHIPIVAMRIIVIIFFAAIISSIASIIGLVILNKKQRNTKQ